MKELERGKILEGERETERKFVLGKIGAWREREREREREWR